MFDDSNALGSIKDQPTGRRRYGRSATCATGAGFTLIELLIVLAVIAVLASLLLPALARAKTTTQSASCLNNLKQLQLAWLSYVHDKDDSFPPNISRRVGLDQVNVVVDGRVPWVVGNPKLDTNTAGIEAGVLYQYVNSVRIYRCPSDKSTVRNQPAIPRTRSYSTPPSFNLDIISHTGFDDTSGTLRKMSSLVVPGPSQTWVFIDEHERSIDDGLFGIGFGIGRSDMAEDGRNPNFWVAYPGDRHNNGANLSYADGHVESHRWRAHRTVKFYTGDKIFFRGDDAANIADLRWLQDRLPPHAP